MANVRPARPITFVLAVSMPPWRSPGAGGSPSASLTPLERTIRARYHSAEPSRSRSPWTMPSPTNQWWVAGSTGVIGLGPLRR